MSDRDVCSQCVISFMCALKGANLKVCRLKLERAQEIRSWRDEVEAKLAMNKRLSRVEGSKGPSFDLDGEV